MASLPPSKQRRQQSPSPDGMRLLTPTNEDSTTPKKMHTPRKDSPVKKRSRLNVELKDAEITFQVLEPGTDMKLSTVGLEKVPDLDSAQTHFLFFHILSFILILFSAVLA